MPQPGRRVETVLFLDMVGSTSVAAQLGDARWREVLTRFNRIVRGELKRFGGHEEDTAGDGYFATFPQPGQAVRCACSIAERVRGLGLEVRSGLHTGETESIDSKRGGLGVVIGARVMSLGGPGEVLVTSTTKELVTGSGLEFEDLSAHELKGVPGTWQIFAVSRIDGRELGSPLAAEEAVKRFEGIHPTPLVRRRSSAIAAGIAVALLAAVVAIVLTTGGTTPSNAVRAPSPITILRVDPTTDVVGPALRSGVQSLHMPGSIFYDGSSLWQAAPPDERKGKVTATIELEQQGFLVGVDSAEGNTMWLVDPEAGTITSLDARTGESGRPLGFGGGNFYDAKIGFGSIWVAAGSVLFRFDLVDGSRREIPRPTGASAGGLALNEDDGVVWVENCGCPDH